MKVNVEVITCKRPPNKLIDYDNIRQRMINSKLSCF